MKVLSIGNSFSTDAHRFLTLLAKAENENIETANLFIGGCSLESHWVNFTENNPFYDLELCGNEGERKITISEALKMEKWDVITLQQVSHMSGMPQTYEPFFKNLEKVVRETNPQAKLYFHQTWAYEKGSEHPGFANYDCSQQKMYECIVKTSKVKAESINAGIIPVGENVQFIRENVPEFDYENGGLSLCRDSFHLSFDYGRFTAAAVWFRTLTGRKISINEFENFDKNLLAKIITAVNNF